MLEKAQLRRSTGMLAQGLQWLKQIFFGLFLKIKN